jgi:6-phosphogluconate dehydrogenase
MQAYAEGFAILRNKDSKDLPDDERFVLNMADIAEVWRRGSVISSWLLDLDAAARRRGTFHASNCSHSTQREWRI